MDNENNHMDAEELAKRVNEYLGNVSDDKRFAELTKRRILDYTTKGLLMKPLKNGNRNYYTEEHFQQLITLRELQSKAGVSEKTLMKAVASTTIVENTSNELQSKALNILNSFSETPNANTKDETSDRVLKSIGTEYVASSISPTGASSSINTEGEIRKSVARSLSSSVEKNNLLNNIDYFKFNDFVDMQSENTQRDKQGIVRRKLADSFYTPENVYEVVPGIKVIVKHGLQLDEKQEEIIKDFTNKMIEAYRKIVDGS